MKTEKGKTNPFTFLLSRINVPTIKNNSPTTSTLFSDSPRRIYAKTATKPGVNASSGNALLISRFFKEQTGITPLEYRRNYSLKTNYY